MRHGSTKEALERVRRYYKVRTPRVDARADPRRCECALATNKKIFLSEFWKYN